MRTENELWLLCYGGGIGPNVWDNELTVSARTIEEAIAKAKPIVEGAGGEISACEWYGGNDPCPLHID